MNAPVINLRKAQTIDLRKSNGQAMTNPFIAIGWNESQAHQGQVFDLDVLAMMQDAAGNAISPEHFIFYNTPGRISQCRGIEISPDNRTGAGEGDDEWLKIDFNKIDPRCEKITLGVSINDAEINGQNFGMIDNAFMRILESEGGREHAVYDLTENYPQYTGMIFGIFEKRNNEWFFTTIGEGLRNGIVEFVERFNFQGQK